MPHCLWITLPQPCQSCIKFMLTLTLHILPLLVDITFCIFIFLSGLLDHTIASPGTYLFLLL